MTKMPSVSIRRDPRFTLEENWAEVVEAVQEAQSRGCLATPLTVFYDDGAIIGWYLHGWEPPPPRCTFKEVIIPETILDYSI